MQRLSTAETAALVKQTLKAAFPTVKFSVRSSVYSMGSSVTVKWTDGPTEKQVQHICNQFEGAGFDGSQDLKYRKPSSELNGQAVEFGTDFVSAARTISPDLMKQAAFRVADETELPLLKVEVSATGSAHIPGGNYQVPFRYFAADDVIAKTNSPVDGEWYQQLVYQVARNISCCEAKPVNLPERVTPEFIDATVQKMFQ